MSSKTFVSIGDFIDLYYKIKQNKYDDLLSKFRLSNNARTVSKWNTVNSSSSYWIIPQIRNRWNKKCTGDPNLEYEDYVMSKLFPDSKGLKMLSVGCGTGARERKFGKHSNFDLIEGIDMAPKLIDDARKYALDSNLNNIKYLVGNFVAYEFEKNAYDIVLFNSSLHHIKDIDTILRTKVLPLLKKGGFLVIFEYVGPTKLQWTSFQLKFANKLLKDLPSNYKIRFKSTSIKRKIYRPGLLRMFLIDPSEAIDSDSIIPSIHKYFKIIEEKKVGSDISHLLFKDIAHNFLKDDTETQQLLSYLLNKEDEYILTTGRSDQVFGIYQK